MKEYEYSIVMTGTKLIESDNAVNGEWPRTIIRDGLEYTVFDGRGGVMEYHLNINKVFQEKDTELATANQALEAQSETITRQQQELGHAAELLRVSNAEKMRYREALIEIRNLSFPDDDSSSTLIYQECTKALSLIDYESALTEDEIARAETLVSEVDNQAETEATSGGFTGKASNIKKVVTKDNEVMATMLINGNECIAFPRTWMQYRNVLESGKELQIVTKEDYSRGYLQMIIQAAELLYESEEIEDKESE